MRNESRDSGSYRNDNNATRNESRTEAYRNQTRTDGYRNQSRSDAYRGQQRNEAYRGESRNNGYRGETRNEGYRAPAHVESYRGGDRNGHISMQGRIRSFTRERDGYRVYLDRDSRSYWVPASALGRHRLSVGLDIRFGGIFRDGGVFVDVLGYPGDPYYNDPYAYGGGYYEDGYVSGRVERVDYRYGRLLLRDDRSGRAIDVDMRAVDQSYRRLDLGDVRPGDRLALSGSWDGGFFRAFRIDSVSAY